MRQTHCEIIVSTRSILDLRVIKEDRIISFPHMDVCVSVFPADLEGAGLAVKTGSRPKKMKQNLRQYAHTKKARMDLFDLLSHVLMITRRI